MLFALPAAPFATGGGLRSAGEARPAGGDGPAGMVIVTDSSLVAPFGRLAAAHERIGLVTRVRTLQSIRAAYPQGRDDAERIRLFLKDARAAWGIEYALLGGDEPLIPMRRAWLDRLPLRTDTGRLLPTDQYYACLDGDWNADGDARWGETPDETSGERGDRADAIPELCVGRAPVADEKQAEVFVAKTVRALARPERHDPLAVLLVAAGSLDPAPAAVPHFAPFAEEIAARLGALVAAKVTRLYRNEGEGIGANPLTLASARAALRKGADLVFLVGFGGPGSFALDTAGGPETLDAEDLLALGRSRPPGHAIALSAFTTVPARLSVGAALIRAEHGGCVSVLGPSDIGPPLLAAAYIRSYLEQGLARHAATIGEAMREALRTMRCPPARDNVRLATLGNVLLGDPALPFPAGPAPAARRSQAGVDPPPRSTRPSVFGGPETTARRLMRACPPSGSRSTASPATWTSPPIRRCSGCSVMCWGSRAPSTVVVPATAAPAPSARGTGSSARASSRSQRPRGGRSSPSSTWPPPVAPRCRTPGSRPTWRTAATARRGS